MFGEQNNARQKEKEVGPEEVEEVIISVPLADWLLYAHLMLPTTLQSRNLLALSFLFFF